LPGTSDAIEDDAAPETSGIVLQGIRVFATGKVFET